MKLSKREIMLLTLALVIMIGALYYNYFYSPIKNDISTLQSEISAQTQQLAVAKAQAMGMEALVKKTEKLSNDLKQQYPEFLNCFEQANILVFLNDLISPYGLKSSITFKDIEEKGISRIAKVHITLSTDYYGLIRILESLEQAVYYNEVESLIISSRTFDQSSIDSDNDFTHYTLKVELTLGFIFFTDKIELDESHPSAEGELDNSNLFS